MNRCQKKRSCNLKNETLEGLKDILIEREIRKNKKFGQYGFAVLAVTIICLAVAAFMLCLTARDAYHHKLIFVPAYFILFCIAMESMKAYTARAREILSQEERRITDEAEKIVEGYRLRTNEFWRIENTVLTLFYTIGERDYSETYDLKDIFDLRMKGVEGNICLDRNVLRMLPAKDIDDMMRKIHDIPKYEVLMPDYYEQSLAGGLDFAYYFYIQQYMQTTHE